MNFILPLLGLVLCVLKALGYITLSWWWCVAPFIVGLVVVGLVFGLAIVVAILAACFGK